MPFDTADTLLALQVFRCKNDLWLDAVWPNKPVFLVNYFFRV